MSDRRHLRVKLVLAGTACLVLGVVLLRGSSMVASSTPVEDGSTEYLYGALSTVFGMLFILGAIFVPKNIVQRMLQVEARHSPFRITNSWRKDLGIYAVCLIVIAAAIAGGLYIHDLRERQSQARRERALKAVFEDGMKPLSSPGKTGTGPRN